MRLFKYTYSYLTISRVCLLQGSLYRSAQYHCLTTNRSHGLPSRTPSQQLIPHSQSEIVPAIDISNTSKGIHRYIPCSSQIRKFLRIITLNLMPTFLGGSHHLFTKAELIRQKHVKHAVLDCIPSCTQVTSRIGERLGVAQLPNEELRLYVYSFPAAFLILKLILIVMSRYAPQRR